MEMKIDNGESLLRKAWFSWPIVVLAKRGLNWLTSSKLVALPPFSTKKVITSSGWRNLSFSIVFFTSHEHSAQNTFVDDCVVG